MLVAKTCPFRGRSCSTETSRTIPINGSGFRCAGKTLTMPAEVLNAATNFTNKSCSGRRSRMNRDGLLVKRGSSAGARTSPLRLRRPTLQRNAREMRDSTMPMKKCGIHDLMPDSTSALSKDKDSYSMGEIAFSYVWLWQCLFLVLLWHRSAVPYSRTTLVWPRCLCLGRYKASIRRLRRWCGYSPTCRSAHLFYFAAPPPT